MKIHRRHGLAAAVTGSVLLILPACGGLAQSSERDAAASTPQASSRPGKAMDASSGRSGTGMDHDTSASGADAFTLTREAASHMPMTADALAGGFDTALKLPGSATSDAASLRAGLSYLLTEHVYLAGIAVDTAYVTGSDSQAFKLAAQALDRNTVALGDAIGSIAAGTTARRFCRPGAATSRTSSATRWRPSRMTGPA